jgi:copper ion binding protein
MNAKIEGMSCNHCVMRVSKALEGIQGVKSVKVSLDTQSAQIQGDNSVTEEVIKQTIEKAGYAFKGLEK